jgi:hypothetical protein
MKVAIAALTVLVLSGLAGAARAQVPPGSYLRSCTDVRVRGGDLSAVCRRAGGGMRRTVLPDVRRCVGDIGNQNGVLVCNRGGPEGPPPPGMHRRRCRRLFAEHEELRKRMERPAGWRERERAIHRLREVEEELARKRCPAY